MHGPAPAATDRTGDPAQSRDPDALEQLLRRDRAIVAGGLLLIVSLAWVYLGRLAGGMSGEGTGGGTMSGMSGMEMSRMEMAMPQMASWTAADLFLLFLMWAVMMIAMMLPSAAPMLLMFASVERRRRERGNLYVPTMVFLGGYLLVWFGYSAVAALAQWGLHEAALLSPAMASTSPMFGGLLLVGAGLFQLTPLKGLCLTRCRSPLGFLTSEWREGTWGAVVMGLRHGAYCAGCCWMLMALLFVAGVMNLLWIAAIAGFILLEKVTSRGEWVSRLGGVLLISWGVWMIATGLA